MGNRGGVLHNDSREIVRQYAGRRWIACLLEFKGRRRTVMSPNRYTELFFLDEAVALAAGHRPCAECRRDRFNSFKASWKRSKGLSEASPLRADSMDLELHEARIDRRREKVTYEALLNSLPDGCFVRIADASYLVWRGSIFRWTAAGYDAKLSQSCDKTVEVLTPAPIVRCLTNGYLPNVHGSLLTL
jgi:hypothetical protein